MYAADVQLSEGDSLDVASSEWSQTKTARRKQKRRGNPKQLSPLDAEFGTSSPAQGDAALRNASRTYDTTGIIQLETSAAAAAVGSADVVVPLGSSAGPNQHAKGVLPRVASPLGKKGLGGFKGRQAEELPAPTGGSWGLPGCKEGQQNQLAPVQLPIRQLDTQEDTDALQTLVSSCVLYSLASHARGTHQRH